MIKIVPAAGQGLAGASGSPGGSRMFDLGRREFVTLLGGAARGRLRRARSNSRCR